MREDPELAAMFRKIREDIEKKAAYDKADTDSKLNASAAFAWLFAALVFGLLHAFDASWWLWAIWIILPALAWLRTAKKHLDIMNEMADPED